MKAKLIIAAILITTMTNVYAAQFFKGTSIASGSYVMNCQDIVDHPTDAEAELNADKEAAKFCDTFGQKESRVSEFTFRSGCQSRGRGFAVYKIEFIEASAEYRCF